MKKWICICLALIFLCSMVGCSQSSGARETLEQELQNLKQKENVDMQLDELLADIQAENKEELKEKLYQLASKTSYKIQSEEEQEDASVAFHILVESVDTAMIMEQFLVSMTELVSSPDYQQQLATMEKEGYHTILVSAMLSALEEKPQTTETDLTITMVKTKEGWKVKNEDSLKQNVFSNLANAIASLV